jgi:Uma2 family endonuclease
MSTSLTKHLTADELLAMPDDGYRYELVKGELIRMSPTGHEHGIVAMNIGAALHQYVMNHDLGVVYAAETGFKIEQNPDTVRAPDVAYVQKERIERVPPTSSFCVGPPDFAVEVTSPSDRLSEVEGKVKEWLAAGTLMVWVVSPALRTVTIYRSLTDVVTLTEKNVADASDVIPGFQISLAQVFQGI